MPYPRAFAQGGFMTIKVGYRLPAGTLQEFHDV